MKLFENRKLMMGGAAALGVALLGGVLGIRMLDSNIEQTKTEITLEAGAQLELTAEDCFKTSNANYKKIEFDTSAVDNLTVGEYDIKASFKENDYVIKVKVQDTTAPEVILMARHVYMSDLTKPVEIEFEYYDATKVTMSLVGAEKIQEMKDITEEKVKILTDVIELPCDQEKLGKITTITDEEGILRGVLKFEDAYGNFYLEEIVIVYDKPDGETTPEDANESDEKTDEKEDGKTDDKKPSSNQAANNQSGNSSTGNTSGNNGSGSTGGTSTPSTPSTPAEPSKPEEPSTPSEPEIEEPESHMTPAMYAAVNAGYYNVIPTASGGYVVMVKGAGEFQYGLQLIDSYLESIGMERVGGYGCNIDSTKNQYMCGVGANEYREKTHADDPGHPDFWD